MEIKSGKPIQLSQSSYESDKRRQAIAVKYHLEMAEKIRDFMGFDHDFLPLGARSEDVYIPTADEIRREEEADRKFAMAYVSKLFASKAKKKQFQAELRMQVTQDPENPQVWERLAMILVYSKDTRPEAIQAYQKAEKLYRKRGNFFEAEKMKREWENANSWK
jgi:hypothetical protein